MQVSFGRFRQRSMTRPDTLEPTWGPEDEMVFTGTLRDLSRANSELRMRGELAAVRH